MPRPDPVSTQSLEGTNPVTESAISRARGVGGGVGLFSPLVGRAREGMHRATFRDVHHSACFSGLI
jgi:hypothetical protein